MGNSASINSIHVVIVGAGVAGTNAAKALDSKVRVTLIEPNDSHNHKIAALRAVVVPGWEKRIRVPLDGLLKNGKIVYSEVLSVETGRVTLADHSVIACDYVILAHGRGKLAFPCDFSDDATTTAAFQTKLRNKQKVIANAKSILVVGGGPVGVELVGEIAAQHPGKKITLAHAGATLLNNSAQPIIPKALEKVNKKLAGFGVDVRLNAKVTNLPTIQGGDGFVHSDNLATSTYTLSSGSSVDADLLIVAVGSARRSGNLVDAVDADNYVKVNPDLSVEGMPKVFCIGDANNLQETKLAYFAAKHAALAASNIQKLEQKKPTDKYVVMDGQKEYGIMFVPLGPKKGVGAMGGSLMGDGLVSLAKGKGLFTKKTWGFFNKPLPEV